MTFYPIDKELNSFRVVGTGVLGKLSEHNEAVKLSFEGFTSTESGCLVNYKNLRILTFDDNLTRLEDLLLKGTQVEYFSFPKNLKELINNPFDEGLPIKMISVHPENNYFVVHDGALYSKDMKIIYLIFGGNGMVQFNVPNSVIELAPGCFSISNTLQHIIIPCSVKIIQRWQFIRMTSIQYIEIQNFESAVTIDEYGLFLETNKDKSIIHYKPYNISIRNKGLEYQSCKHEHLFLNLFFIYCLILILQ